MASIESLGLAIPPFLWWRIRTSKHIRSRKMTWIVKARNKQEKEVTWNWYNHKSNGAYPNQATLWHW